MMLPANGPTLTNGKALLSVVAAAAAILCFCGGVAPIPLTALVCFPLTGIFGLIAISAGIAGLHGTRMGSEQGHNLALAGMGLGGVAVLAALCMTISGVALIRILIDAPRHWIPAMPV